MQIYYFGIKGICANRTNNAHVENNTCYLELYCTFSWIIYAYY